jgi:hypothetical protein
VRIDEKENLQAGFQLSVSCLRNLCCDGEKMIKPMLMNVWLKSVQALANPDCFPPGRDVGIEEVEAESQVVQASYGSTSLRIP